MKIILALIIALWAAVVEAKGPVHLLINQDTGEIVSARNEDVVRSIASITKLMTALVVVEADQNMQELIAYSGNIFPNRRVTRQHLMESLLIRSDNAAAESLARAYPGGRAEFIRAMNVRARTLGMINTQFVDPSGIGSGNRSTAMDLSLLISEAHTHSEIRDTSTVRFFYVERQQKNRTVQTPIGNTNRYLLFEYDNISLSKTGFTTPAGLCLAMTVVENGQKYIVVILGEPSRAARENRARQLINSYVKL